MASSIIGRGRDAAQAATSGFGLENPMKGTRVADGGPSMEEALRYRLQHSVSRVPKNGFEVDREKIPYTASTGYFYGCCKTDSELSGYGSGISTFFKLEKSLAILFGLLAALSMPAIIINSYGPGDKEGVPASGLATTTLGNMASLNGTATLKLAGGATLDADRAALIYVALDFAGAVIFGICVLLLRGGIAREVAAVDRAVVSADDYSIYLPDVSRGTTEHDLREWVTTVSALPERPEGFEIADVCVVEDDSRIIALMVRRGQLLRSIQRVEGKARARAAAIAEGRHLDAAMSGPRAFLCGGSSLEAERLSLEASVAMLGERIKALKTQIAEKAVANDARLKHLGAAGAALAAAESGYTSGVDFVSTAAFITFEDAVDAKLFLQKFPTDPYSVYCPKRRRMLKGRPVTVRRAPAPSAVLWQNLHIKSCEQRMRQSASTLASMLFIVASFVLIFFASYQNNRYQMQSAIADCRERSTSAWVKAYTTWHTPAEEAALMATSDLSDKHLFCYCASLPWNTMSASAVKANPWSVKCPTQACTRAFAADPKAAFLTDPVCSSWAKDKAASVGLTVASSLVIAFVNINLGSAIRYFSGFEGHHSVELQDKSIALRLFFSQFFNTAVLVVLINVAWTALIPNVEYPTGRYTDFESGWYANVGSSLMTTMLVQIISAHAYYLLDALRVSKLLKQVKPTAVTQSDLNESLLGPQMDVAQRHASMFNTIFVCYTFSAGMPLMMPIAAASFTLQYWIDKWLFLRYYRAPPMTKNAVSARMGHLLMGALLLHLAVGTWMLGGIKSFDSALGKYSPLDLSWVKPTAVTNSSAGGSGEVLYVTDSDGRRINDTATLYAAMYNTTSDGSAYELSPIDMARVLQPAAAPLFVLFVATAGLYFLSLAISCMAAAAWNALDLATCGLAGRCQRYLCANPKLQDAPSYSRATSAASQGTPHAIHGTHTYNILAQPELQALLHIDPAVAARSKRLADALGTEVTAAGGGDAIKAVGVAPMAHAALDESKLRRVAEPAAPAPAPAPSAGHGYGMPVLPHVAMPHMPHVAMPQLPHVAMPHVAMPQLPFAHPHAQPVGGYAQPGGYAPAVYGAPQQLQQVEVPVAAPVLGRSAGTYV